MDGIKLDLGCGTNKKSGFSGVDCIAFPGVDIVCNLTQQWPWANSSVDEANCEHTLEHFTAMERVHFCNELYRVLKPKAKCFIVVPNWASCRAYGDPTHQWPPVSEFWFYYLSKEWRLGNPAKKMPPNAPHTDASNVPGMYDCDFESTCGYSLNPFVTVRSQEWQQFAMQFYKEVALDIVATITKV